MAVPPPRPTPTHPTMIRRRYCNERSTRPRLRPKPSPRGAATEGVAEGVGPLLDASAELGVAVDALRYLPMAAEDTVVAAVVAAVEFNLGVGDATVGVFHPPTRRKRRSPSLTTTQTTAPPLIAGIVHAPQTALQTTKRFRRPRRRRRRRGQLLRPPAWPQS